MRRLKIVYDYDIYLVSASLADWLVFGLCFVYTTSGNFSLYFLELHKQSTLALNRTYLRLDFFPYETRRKILSISTSTTQYSYACGLGGKQIVSFLGTKLYNKLELNLYPFTHMTLYIQHNTTFAPANNFLWVFSCFLLV